MTSAKQKPAKRRSRIKTILKFTGPIVVAIIGAIGAILASHGSGGSSEVTSNGSHSKNSACNDANIAGSHVTFNCALKVAPDSSSDLSSNPRVRIVELTGSWSQDNFIEAVFERNTNIVALYLKSGMSATTLHKGASAILWGFQGRQNGDPVALIKTFQEAGFKVDEELEDSFLMDKLTEGFFPLHFETSLAPKGYSPRYWRGEFLGSLLLWIVERANWAGPIPEDIEVMDYLISQGANCSVPLSFLEFNRDSLGGTRPYRELLSMMQDCA
jgi:hypothetical protein